MIRPQKQTFLLNFINQFQIKLAVNLLRYLMLKLKAWFLLAKLNPNVSCTCSISSLTYFHYLILRHGGLFHSFNTNVNYVVILCLAILANGILLLTYFGYQISNMSDQMSGYSTLLCPVSTYKCSCVHIIMQSVLYSVCAVDIKLEFRWKFLLRFLHKHNISF